LVRLFATTWLWMNLNDVRLPAPFVLGLGRPTPGVVACTRISDRRSAGHCLSTYLVCRGYFVCSNVDWLRCRQGVRKSVRVLVSHLPGLDALELHSFIFLVFSFLSVLRRVHTHNLPGSHTRSWGCLASRSVARHNSRYGKDAHKQLEMP